MEFNSTFSDPSRDIYYPSTWGGPTAMEKFDDMKKEFWFVGLVFIGSLIFGVFWWFLVYTFTTFVRFLAKISSYSENHPDRVAHEEYLQWNYMVRWCLIGCILYGFTVAMLMISLMRLPLLYGLAFWATALLLKPQTLWLVQRIRRWILKDQMIGLNQQ